MGPVRLRLLRDARDSTAVGVNQPAAEEQVTIAYAFSANCLREMEVLVSVPSEDLECRRGHLPQNQAVSPSCLARVQVRVAVPVEM